VLYTLSLTQHCTVMFPVRASFHILMRLSVKDPFNEMAGLVNRRLFHLLA